MFVIDKLMLGLTIQIIILPVCRLSGLLVVSCRFSPQRVNVSGNVSMSLTLSFFFVFLGGRWRDWSGTLMWLLLFHKSLLSCLTFYQSVLYVYDIILPFHDVMYPDQFQDDRYGKFFFFILFSFFIFLNISYYS